jgi:hypothetical protein
VVRLLRERYPAVLLWILRGRLLIDMADKNADRLPYPISTDTQGLIVETGVSKLARHLSVSAEDIPKEHWRPESLLPGVDEVLFVPESHDEVYTSAALLRNMLHFFLYGKFAKQSGIGGKIR